MQDCLFSNLETAASHLGSNAPPSIGWCRHIKYKKHHYCPYTPRSHDQDTSLPGSKSLVVKDSIRIEKISYFTISRTPLSKGVLDYINLDVFSIAIEFLTINDLDSGHSLGAGLFVFKSGDICFLPWLKCTTLYRLMRAYKIQKASLLPPIHHGHVTRTRHYQLVLYVSRIFYSICISYVVKYSASCFLWNFLSYFIEYSLNIFFCMYFRL